MTARRTSILALLRDRDGAALVEFAIVFPVFLLAVVGGLYVAMMGFSVANLQNAVRAAARCASVGLAACSDNTKTAAYAKARFVSVTADVPTFTASTASCGRKVDGTLNFTFNAGLFRMNVPLRSTACFP